jgi:Chitobiase/beta-hexosaminidase C-terminal domain
VQFLSKMVGGRSVVAAVALVGFLMMAGCAASSPSGNNVTAKPAFSPAGGTYTSSQTVTISDATPGAVMYCTTDGTAPTTSSPRCSQPTTVFQTEFLQAIAAAPSMTGSEVAAAGYTINLSAAATPTFAPAGGTYTAAQTLTIADATTGANIYYTVDGTVPTPSSTLYTGPIAISKGETVSAIALASGFSNSGVASAAYVISAGGTPPPSGGTPPPSGGTPPPSGGTPSTTATPTFSVAAGTYSSTQTISLSDATAGATIYYTTNGSTPTASSTQYRSSITVAQSETISAIAVAAGTSSSVASAAYTISAAGTPPPAATAAPTFSVAAGSYSSPQTVILSDATAGATIYYTTNGSTPTASSTQYSGSITVAQSETLSAIAVAAGTSSLVATAAYTISAASTPPPPPTGTAIPTISPAGGTYITAQMVTISDTTAGATIFYTTDGSMPTIGTSSATMPYTGPIAVSQNEVVKAIALAAGNTSSVAQASFTLFLGGIPAPTISPTGGTFGAAQTVTLTDSAATANLYYTTDGSTPTASSTPYTGPISVSVAETLKAIAIVSGSSSVVSSAAFAFGNSSLSGAVLSGSSPVVGAQVQLYAAGQSGYGSAGTPLLGAPVTTDASGAFTVNYNCPASPGDLVYLVAVGGNAGAGSNSGLALMTALGPCGALNGTTPVTVNEVTTVASAYALSPFMTTAPNVGSSGSSVAYAGLKNAFMTVSNLANLNSGNALTITPAYATSPVPFLNTSTVPQKRIDTLANILNACASSNGTSGSCANLYNSTAGTGAIPVNTLQAILNIAQSPGANAATLFGLASPTGPFQPALSAAPNDWTLALTFTGGGLGIAPGVSVEDVFGNPVVMMVNSALAIDATGNIWVTSWGSDGTGFSESGLIAGFNNQGAPLTPATTLSAATPAIATTGGFLPQTQGTSNADVIAVDTSGNLWVGSGDSRSGFTEIANSTSGSSSGQSLIQEVADDNGMSVQSIAFDTTGNVWVGGFSNIFSEEGFLGELDTSGNLNANFQFFGADGTGSVDGFGYQPLQQLTFDSTGALWGSSLAGDLYQINLDDGSIAFDPFLNPTGGPSFGVYTPLVADGSGNVYGCASIDHTSHKGGQSLNVFNAASTSFTTLPITSGRGCGNQMAMDGVGHIFAVTGDPLSHGSGSPGVGVIDEFRTDGTLISPATGYTGTSSGEARTINPDANVVYSGPTPPGAGVSGVAVDGSGNLWILNVDTGASASTSGNVLVEYIGLAVPVITPVAAAQAGGQMAVRP